MTGTIFWDEEWLKSIQGIAPPTISKKPAPPTPPAQAEQTSLARLQSLSPEERARQTGFPSPEEFEKKRQRQAEIDLLRHQTEVANSPGGMFNQPTRAEIEERYKNPEKEPGWAEQSAKSFYQALMSGVVEPVSGGAATLLNMTQEQALTFTRIAKQIGYKAIGEKDAQSKAMQWEYNVKQKWDAIRQAEEIAKATDRTVEEVLGDEIPYRTDGKTFYDELRTLNTFDAAGYGYTFNRFLNYHIHDVVSGIPDNANNPIMRFNNTVFQLIGTVSGWAAGGRIASLPAEFIKYGGRLTTKRLTAMGVTEANAAVAYQKMWHDAGVDTIMLSLGHQRAQQVYSENGDLAAAVGAGLLETVTTKLLLHRAGTRIGNMRELSIKLKPFRDFKLSSNLSHLQNIGSKILANKKLVKRDLFIKQPTMLLVEGAGLRTAQAVADYYFQTAVVPAAVDTHAQMAVFNIVKTMGHGALESGLLGAFAGFGLWKGGRKLDSVIGERLDIRTKYESGKALEKALQYIETHRVGSTEISLTAIRLLRRYPDNSPMNMIANLLLSQSGKLSKAELEVKINQIWADFRKLPLETRTKQLEEFVKLMDSWGGKGETAPKPRPTGLNATPKPESSVTKVPEAEPVGAKPPQRRGMVTIPTAPTGESSKTPEPSADSDAVLDRVGMLNGPEKQLSFIQEISNNKTVEVTTEEGDIVQVESIYENESLQAQIAAVQNLETLNVVIEQLEAIQDELKLEINTEGKSNPIETSDWVAQTLRNLKIKRDVELEAKVKAEAEAEAAAKEKEEIVEKPEEVV